MERRGQPRTDVVTTAVVTARHHNGVVFLIENISIAGARLIGPLIRVVIEVDE